MAGDLNGWLEGWMNERTDGWIHRCENRGGSEQDRHISPAWLLKRNQTRNKKNLKERRKCIITYNLIKSMH
jgi:hypothetical protein